MVLLATQNPLPWEDLRCRTSFLYFQWNFSYLLKNCTLQISKDRMNDRHYHWSLINQQRDWWIKLHFYTSHTSLKVRWDMVNRLQPSKRYRYKVINEFMYIEKQWRLPIQFFGNISLAFINKEIHWELGTRVVVDAVLWQEIHLFNWRRHLVFTLGLL